MKRKTYIKHLYAITVAAHKTPDGIFTSKLGESLRRIRDNAKNAPEYFGSYEAALNCDAMRWVRERYMGEKF